MIRSLIERQLDTLILNLIETRVKDKKDITLYEINQFKKEATHILSNFQSLFQAYELPSRTNTGVYRTHRQNLEDINSDFHIFNSVINDIYSVLDRVTESRFVSNIYKQNIIQKIIVMAKDIITSLITKSNAYTINFSKLDDINQDETTALIDTDTKQCKCKELNKKEILYFGDYEENDVSIVFRGEHITGSVKDGRVSDLLKKGYYNKSVIFTVEQDTRSECKVIVDIPVSRDRTAKRINNVAIDILDYITNLACRFYVSKDSKTFVPVTDVLPNNNNKYNVTFNGDEYTYVRIEFIKGIEDERIRTVFVYRIGVKGISIRNTVFSSQSVLVSNGIQCKDMDNNVLVPRRVSIDVSDYVPQNTSINYYIRSTSTVWKSVTPSNKAVAANNIIEFGSVKEYVVDDIKPIEIQDSWSTIQPANGFGNIPLFNILDILPTSGTLVSNGRINIQSSTGIIDSKDVTLTRGKGDYSIIREPEPLSGTVDEVKYAFTYNESTKLYDPIDLFIQMPNVPFMIISGGYIELGDYEVINPQDISVLYEDKIKHGWTYDAELNRIQFTNVVAGKIVYVTFNASITSVEEAEKSVITIDTYSITYANPLTTGLYAEGNFLVDISNKTIRINPLNDIAKGMDNNAIVLVSFKYQLERLNKGEYYRTFVSVKDETLLKIVPFTLDEIQKGNFHYIDGVNISSLREFTLTPGKHIIETTQPYPSDINNPLDVNLYTNKRCKAGIILPIGVKQDAFELPQKNVSTFNLSSVVRINDHRSFAFQDNAVWINRVPEFIPQYMLNDPTRSHVKGYELLGKKVIYTEANEFESYVAIPETFVLTYSEQNIANEEADTDVYIKSIMNINGKSTEMTPVINSVTVNFF